MSDLVKLKAQSAHSKTGRNRQLFYFGVFIALLLIGVVFVVAFQNTRSMRNSLEKEVQSRQQNLVESRVFAIDNWLNDNINKAKMLATSEFFQLFASEVNRLDNLPMLFTDTQSQGTDDDDELDKPSSRLPLMRTQLTEFTSYANFESARIVNSKGDVYLATDPNMLPLTPAQLLLAKKVIETGKVVFGSVSKGRNGLNINYYLPIFPPMYEEQGGKPVSVLVLNQVIGPALNTLLKQELAETDRRLGLVQMVADGYQSVILEGLQIKPLPYVAELEPVMIFAMRPSTITDSQVYSYGEKLRLIDWWVVAEDKATTILNKYTSFAKTAYSLAALASLVLILLISAGWWWLVGKEQGAINKQFKDLLVVIESQKKLLDGINNTMVDPISLTDSTGIFRYVNNAFAQAVGREEQDIIGLDMPAVLGFDTAKRLNASDQHVLMSGEQLQIQDILWLQSKRFIFQISKTPLKDAQSKLSQGVVSVYRDITQVVEAEEHSRRVVQQTIDALIGTIEQADPFLGGHSRIMGQIAGLIAKQLQLADTDIATIEAAANLSQIGKMFVPREILLKPGVLTPEEKELMEQHVEHTVRVLKNIEFDLPVIAAIYQLNERLDGNGYPNKLTDKDISMHARVLAVANAFAAMARPRAYRPAIPIEEVLRILEEQTGVYDQTVVASLKEVLTTPIGQQVVAKAALAKHE